MVNDAYQNRLLETIAEKPERTDATGINAVVGESTENLDTLVAKQRELKLSLVEELPITALFGLIDSLEETDRQLLVTDLRSANFWFPVKRLGMEMIFLAPLVLVFWFWNSKSIVNNRPFQVLVSSHLLVIVFIPVVFKIIELLYDIIPRKLLQQLIELLESLHLIALWHYLLMGVAILLALACVYVFQKRWFSHEKLLEKRIAKGQCQDCGGKLPTDCIACPRCGFKQFEDCSNCQDPTYVHGKYCINCGIDRS